MSMFGVRVNGVPVWTGAPVTLTRDSIGSTSTVELTVKNTTDAADGAQQYSPGISQIGQGFSSNAGGASMPVETRWEVRPVQGAAAPTFNYVLMGRVNNGAWVDLLTVTQTGEVTTAGVMVAGSDIRTGPTGLIYWLTRAAMNSPAAGVFQINNNTSLASGIRFQFDGTTAPMAGSSVSSLASAGKLVIGTSATIGTVAVTTSTGGSGLFALKGPKSTSAEISDPDNTFSVVGGTTNSFNVYWDSTAANYAVENRTGSTGAVTAVMLGR